MNYEKCPKCLHDWHGLACIKVGCICPPAWVPPEEDE